MNHCKVLLAVAFLGLLACDRAEDSPQAGKASTSAPTSKLTAKDILAKVDETYATCRSYVDTGMVKTVFTGNSVGFVDEKPFKTAFVRPDRFRYEFTSNPSYIPLARETRFIIWAHGDDVKTWWDVQPGVNSNETLSMAIAKATGVSGGSAHGVPVLLMPKLIGGARETALRGLERLEDAEENGVLCFRVKGNPLANDSQPRTLWISQKTFLIHRIDDSLSKAATAESPAFNASTTTTYTPQINIDVKSKDLAFDAPEDK